VRSIQSARGWLVPEKALCYTHAEVRDVFHNRGLSVVEEFGRAGFLLVFALAFPLIPIVASVVFAAFRLRPDRPDPIKSDTYECGVETEGGDALVQFNARYYVIALLFVVFDVEAVFLYPWAVAFRQLGLFAFVEAVLFLAILVLGYVYAWRRKALEWA